MNKVWIMPGVNGAPHVVRSGDGRRVGDPGLVPIPATTLMGWLANPDCRASVLQMFEATAGYPAASSFAVTESDLRRCIVQRLERAFQLGRLIAATDLATAPRAALPGRAAGAAPSRPTVRPAVRPATSAEAAPQQRRSVAPSPKRTWIEIVLVDDHGRPVARERCRMQLPDGTVRVERLDGQGRLRVDGIEPGTCEVSFPDRDGRDWRAA